LTTTPLDNHPFDNHPLTATPVTTTALSLSAVMQARASGDYARPEGNTKPWSNVVTLGGASLLLGATKVAPSKDTLWTRSPQPPTSSDRTNAGL
jgi:hypothetical protein